MQTTRLRAGLLAALLLMPLSPASAEPEADVLLVLDNSGSMKQNDPKVLMREDLFVGVNCRVTRGLG